MNIAQAARHSGLNAKTIRYYEDVGLLPLAQRGDNGYRDYGEDDVRLLRFVGRARDLGFTVRECIALVGFYRDPGRASHDVKALALEKVAAIENKISEFTAMRDELKRLADACRGDAGPDCAILSELQHAPSKRG